MSLNASFAGTRTPGDSRSEIAPPRPQRAAAAVQDSREGIQAKGGAREPPVQRVSQLSRDAAEALEV